MLVLEKKQGQNIVPDAGRNSAQEKGGPSEINEPGAAYHPKSGSNDHDAGQSGPFNEIPGAGQSEDDLPF
jgi:hypothetical protein